MELPGSDHELRYHSLYGLSRNACAQSPASIISPMLWSTGAKHGTVNGPQWMKMPNLASSYQVGSGLPANG